MRALTWFVIGANTVLLAGNLYAWHHLTVLRRRWKAAMRWWARDDVRAIALRESSARVEHPGIAYTKQHASEGRCPLYVEQFGKSDYRCGLAITHPGACMPFGEAAMATGEWWSDEGGADGLKAHWRSLTPESNPERYGAGESERTRWTI
jgi:hypothetical protein